MGWNSDSYTALLKKTNQRPSLCQSLNGILAEMKKISVNKNTQLTLASKQCPNN